MIKINLLPPGIYEKKIVRNLAILFAVLAVVVAGSGFGYRLKLNSNIAAKTVEVEDVEARQRMVQGLKSQAASELAKIDPMVQKVMFIENVFAHNEKWPALYEELAKYTYKKVSYRRLTPSADSLQIEAYTPSISDAGRFLLNMYKANHIFASVSISGVPGYPVQAEQQTGFGAGADTLPGGPEGEGPALPTGVSPHLYRYGGIGAVTAGVARAEIERTSGLNFTVTCTLREPITPPLPPGGVVSPGAPGGMPGPMGPMTPQPMGPGPMGPGGAPPGGGFAGGT